MQDTEGQKLTYDYAELDEHLSKMISPNELDQYFRGLNTAFTRTLQELVSLKGDIAFMPEEMGLRSLDEFFQFLGRLKKEGGQ